MFVYDLDAILNENHGIEFFIHTSDDEKLPLMCINYYHYVNGDYDFSYDEIEMFRVTQINVKNDIVYIGIDIGI